MTADEIEDWQRVANRHRLWRRLRPVVVLFAITTIVLGGIAGGAALITMGLSLWVILALGGLAVAPLVVMTWFEERQRSKALALAGDLVARPVAWAQMFTIVGMFGAFAGTFWLLTVLPIPRAAIGYVGGAAGGIGGLLPRLVLRTLFRVRCLPSRTGQLLVFFLWFASFLIAIERLSAASTTQSGLWIFGSALLLFWLASPRIRFGRAMSRGDLPALRSGLVHWRFAGVSAPIRAEAFRALDLDIHAREFLHDITRWSGPQKPALLAAAAESWRNTGGLHEARVLARASLAMSPDQPEPWAILAQCDLVEDAITQDTATLFEQALLWHDRGQRFTRNAAHWRAQLAQVQHHLGLLTEAQQTLQQAIETVPEHQLRAAESWYAIAQTQLAMGQSASQSFANATSAAPGSRWQKPTAA